MSDREQDITDRLDRENNPLPEDVSEYVQKVRGELKQYEEQKKYFEKRRKKEIVLELIGLLEQHDYPKEQLRLIIAQELGDYISTSYIENILQLKQKHHVKIYVDGANREVIRELKTRIEEYHDYYGWLTEEQIWALRNSNSWQVIPVNFQKRHRDT